MANPFWNTTSSDNWTTASDWSTGVVPGAGDDVTVAQGDPQITTNVGTVKSVTDSATVSVEGSGALTTTGNFTNTGSLDVDDSNSGSSGGSSLTVGGTFTNSNYTQIGNYYSLINPTTVTVNALSNTGQLEVRSSSSTVLSTLKVNSAAGFGTAGKLTGSVDLTNDASIVFASGEISDIASGSELSLGNSDSYIADAGATTSNSALTGLSTIEGNLYLYNGSTVTTTAGLTNSGGLYLDQNSGSGGSSLTVGGTLTNSNFVQVGNFYNLTTPTTVTVNALSNTGQLEIRSSSSTVLSTLKVNGAAGFGTAGKLTGSVDLTNDATIVFASGEISDIASGSELSLGNSDSYIADAGATTSNSALTGLSTVEGNLYLYNGSTVTTTAGLINSGGLYLDQNSGSGGSSLTVGGTLTNSNFVQVGNFYNLTTPTTVTVNALSNTGQLEIRSSSSTVLSTLKVNGVAGFGTAGKLTGSVDLTNDATIVFASGEISDIASGSELSLGNSDSYIADAGATTSNSALTGLSTIEGSFYLANGSTLTTTAGLTNSGGLYLDQNSGSGGSSLTVGGTLTNSNLVQVGNFYNLTTPTTVTVNALSNTGQLEVRSSSTTVLSTLKVNGAAGFGTAGKLTGNVDLNGDASIVFASGQITDIAAGSELSLNNSNSYIADAGATTSNSALTGLSTIEGSFYLANGSTLTTTGGLTNTGGLYLDLNTNNGGSSLTVGGTLTNNNYVQVGNYYTLSSPTTLTANALANTGSLEIRSNSSSVLSTLKVNGVAGFGTAGKLTGNVDLTNDATIVFASGEISDIASGSELSLGNSDSYIADAGSTTSNSALTGLSTIEGSFYLANGSTLTTTGGLTNAGGLYLDLNTNNGGSSLTVGGTLTNSNTVQVGNYYTLSSPTTLTVNALSNTGALEIRSSSSTVLSTLNVKGVAGFGTAGKLTGSVDLNNDATIVFASGEITDIASASELSLNNSNSYVADAGSTTSNSALTGLSTIEGSFYLSNDSTLTTTGGLTNTGGLYLDLNTNNGGASLTVGGTLTNSNTVQVGNYYTLSSPTTLTVNGLANTGTVNVRSSSASVASLLQVKGAASNNGGQINVNAFGAVKTNGFTQGTSGSVNLEIQGQTAGQFGTIATTGGVTLNGGSLVVPVDNTSLAAGQTYDLMTFTGGQLSGLFNTLNIANTAGDGTSVSLGNNLYAGLVYGDAAGTLKLVVASATTTADTWTAGTGTWGTGASWSNGVPTFYSDVTIGSTSTAKVTLTTDATVNSLALNASDTLTSQTGTDFSIGSTLSVGSGATLSVGGEMFIDSTATNNGSIVDAGTVVDIRGGSSGTGTYTIDNGATLEFGASDANTVNFAGTTALLKLDQPASVTGTLANLVAGDTIDLVGTSVSGTVVNGNTLTVTKGDGSTLTYTLANQQANTAFTTQGDGSGGTDLVLVTTVQPGFTAVTDSPASGDYTLNKVITLTLTPSVTATVTGTPTLTLNDGGTATYDAAKSSGTALVFDYTVGANQNTSSLMATSLNLPTGSSITNGSGTNFNLALSGITQTGPQIDTTAPTVAITSAGGNVSAASQTVSGTVDTADAGTLVSVFDNGSTTALGTATVQSNGTWSTTVALALGSNSLVAKDTDGAGNTGTSNTVVETYGVAPVVTETLAQDTGSSNTDKTTSIDTVTGSGDNGAVVHFTIDGAASSTTATASASGVYSFTPAGLSDGTHTIVASETNAFGTSSSPVLTFTLDTKPPVVAITSTGGTVTATSQTIAGTVTDAHPGSTVTLYDNGSTTALGTATVQTNGTWTTSVTLGTGQNSIVANDTDLAGNTGTSGAVVYTVQPGQVPAVTEALSHDNGASSTDRITNNPALFGTGDNNATVTLSENGTVLGTTTANSTGVWAFTPTGLADGAHSIVASETNANGTGKAVLNFTLDTTKPAVTIALKTDSGSSATDHYTNSAVVGGGGDPNATVQLTIDGSTTPVSVTAGSSGAWTYAPVGLADGAHMIVASETDLAGNSHAVSLSFTLDTKAPVVTEALTTDSGTSSTDTLTNVDTVTGSGDPNAVVHFTIDGAASSTTATANASGVYSFTPTGLSDATHTIVASETDLAGNTGTVPLTFTLDTTAPAVAITSTGGNVTAASQTIAGTVTDAHPGSTVTLYDNGSATALGTATVQSNGTWSTSVTLTSGQNSIVAKDTDLAGNTGASSALVYSLGAVPSLTEALTTDTGSSSTDKTTSIDTVTGSGVAGAVVSFTIDGVAATTTATADASGVYSYTPAGLADGPHTIVASETNAYGTGSSAPLTFMLDTKAPAVTEALTTDSGTSSTDAITNVDTLTGGGDPNAVVHFTIDGSASTTTATANASGVYSFTPTGLSDGSHTIVASETDLAGNTGSVPLTFTLDTTAPVVAITSSGGTVAAISQTIAGTVTDAHPGSTVTLYDNGSTTALGTATVQSNGTWSTTVTLASGQNSIVANDTDLAGNTGTSGAVVYTVQPGQVPVVTEALSHDNGASSTDRITNNPALFGTGDNNATVTLSENGTVLGTTTANSSGAWAFTPTGLADGAHSIVASETNATGTGKAVLNFTLDTTKPAVTIALKTDSGSSATDHYTNSAVVGGGGDPNATVQLTVDGGSTPVSVTADPSGTWTYAPVGLADGAHMIVASETDLAGNSHAVSLSFTLDTTKPAVTEALKTDSGTSSTDTITNVDTLTGSGDANAIVHFTIDGVVSTTTATANASGQWTYTPASLADGQHTIVATETDKAGNVGTATLGFTLDTTPPQVAITSAGGLVSTATQTVSGTGEAGTKVALFDGTNAIGTSVTVDSQGNWSEQVTLAVGNHPLTAKDTDTAGNVGTSQSTTYLYDHAPVITSGGGGTNATYVINDKTQAITTMTATDADAGDSVSYFLLDQTGHQVTSTGNFTIDAGSGALSFNSAPTTGTYQLTAGAVDSYGVSTMQTIKVDVGSDSLVTGDVGDHGVTDTFVFNGTTPFEQIQNFRPTDVVNGAYTDPHGILALAHSMFTGATAGETGSALTDLIGTHSAQIGADTLILTDTSNVLDLQNVNRTALLAHASNFALT